MAESDRIKAWVESYIQGARVLAVHEQEDGTVETEMTLTITPLSAVPEPINRFHRGRGPCFRSRPKEKIFGTTVTRTRMKEKLARGHSTIFNPMKFRDIGNPSGNGAGTNTLFWIENHRWILKV